jgi:hypothetical protein
MSISAGVLPRSVPRPSSYCLLMAGNHGDEYEGQVALGKLIRSLEAEEVCGRIIILPSTNFPAAMAGMRTSPLDEGSGSVRPWVLSANNSPSSNSSKPVRLRSNPASPSSPISSAPATPRSARYATSPQGCVLRRRTGRSRPIDPFRTH